MKAFARLSSCKEFCFLDFFIIIISLIKIKEEIHFYNATLQQFSYAKVILDTFAF